MIFDFGKDVYSTDKFALEVNDVRTLITMYLEGSITVFRAEKKDPFDYLVNKED